MFSQKSSKSKNKPHSQQPKKEKPKPQWTTDFVDRSHYKLSQTQMIQKKAALQSKHRQQARQQLQQRRRKLQQGIIDQQTRKIYQTALISKKIDINPPIRKNLTQMIRYQKQQKQRREQQQYYEEQNDEDYDQDKQQQGTDLLQQSAKQIKEAQNFIKKFQKAKKQQKIQRAVQILTKNKSKQKKTNKKQNNQNQSQNQIKNHFLTYMMNDKSSIRSKQNQSNFTQDQAISSIQNTIKFMEQKLFAAKKIVDQHSKSFIHDADDKQEQDFYSYNKPQKQSQNFKKQNLKQKERQRQIKNKLQNKNKQQLKFNNFMQNQDDELQFGQRMAQISQLRIKLKDEEVNDSDDQCMDTIRRMRQLMDQKQIQFQTNGYNNKNKQSKKLKQNIQNNHILSPSIQFNSTIQKNLNDSQAQVSFNLTANDDLSYQFESFPKKNISKQISSKNNWEITKNNKNNQIKKNKQDQYQEQYQKIKQNLFDCLNKDSFDQDQQESSDSLMVKNKIDLWKKELKTQNDPQDDENMNTYENYGKTTNMNFKKTNALPNKAQSNRFILKQNDQNQEQEQIQFVKNTYLSPYSQSMASTGFMKKPPLVKKSNQNVAQIDALKNMISNASNQIQKIQIQPLKIEPINQTGGVLGFDFRGSINLKKNVLSK